LHPAVVITHADSVTGMCLDLIAEEKGMKTIKLVEEEVKVEEENLLYLNSEHFEGDFR